ADDHDTVVGLTNSQVTGSRPVELLVTGVGDDHPGTGEQHLHVPPGVLECSYSVRVAPPVGENHRYVHVSAPSPAPVDGWAVAAVGSVPMDPIGRRVYRVQILTSCPCAI